MFYKKFIWFDFGIYFAVIVLSISPILIGELTKGHQEARAYFPGLVGILLFIGYSLQCLLNVLPVRIHILVYCFFVLFLIFNFVWNIRFFLQDILPARMATAYLAKIIEKLKINEIFTYDTPYNDIFLYNLPADVLRRIKIIFIKSLSQVKTGYVAIPGRSSKAFGIASSRVMFNGDLTDDDALNLLIDSGEINKCAVRSFKAFGTSRIWVHENEISSYLDFLNLISEKDRQLGKAWLLDGVKIDRVINSAG